MPKPALGEAVIAAKARELRMGDGDGDGGVRFIISRYR